MRKAPTNDGKFEAVVVVMSEECGKYLYRRRKTAATKAARSRKATGEPIYAYRCDKGCRGYHIGHPNYAAYKKTVGLPD